MSTLLNFASCYQVEKTFSDKNLSEGEVLARDLIKVNFHHRI